MTIQSTTDQQIIELLFDGLTQQEISAELKRRGATPNSLSYIEKFIKELRSKHKAKTMFHLGAILAVKKYISP